MQSVQNKDFGCKRQYQAFIPRSQNRLCAHNIQGYDPSNKNLTLVSKHTCIWYIIQYLHFVSTLACILVANCPCKEILSSLNNKNHDFLDGDNFNGQLDCGWLADRDRPWIKQGNKIAHGFVSLRIFIFSKSFTNHVSILRVPPRLHGWSSWVTLGVSRRDALHGACGPPWSLFAWPRLARCKGGKKGFLYMLYICTGDHSNI